MLLRLRNATASMSNMMRQQERIANNLANANTVGYKRDRFFSEALNERLDAEGAPRTDRLSIQGASQEQGALEKTGNPLDVAIDGDGFFVVTDADTGAARYTRAGHFVSGPDGQLQTPSGQLVEGEGGPIQLPEEGGPIEISASGDIRAGEQRLGRLRVVRFENPEQLTRLDETTFDAAGLVPEDMEQPRVVQGHLESSNVNAVREMTDMITHFRLFESQQKMMRTTDQILGQATKDLGKF